MSYHGTHVVVIEIRKVAGGQGSILFRSFRFGTRKSVGISYETRDARKLKIRRPLRPWGFAPPPGTKA
jgi:hypothetical protein